jgi:tripartite-type tricarboxylate transporter receptor subunit TctC
MRRILIALLICAAAGAAGAQPADRSGFYSGKNLSYIVATNPGGGYDAYARLIAGFLEKHLVADHVIIRNVPGAGHLVGANTLARSKPDGLTIGTFNAGLIYGQLAGNRSLRFDLRDLAWIGKAAGEPRAVVVGSRCAIQSMDALLAAETPVMFAGAGIGSASYADTRLLSEALSLSIKIIPGYEGTEAEMAMLRGEICGLVASTSSMQSFVDAGNGSYILTIGARLDGVPNAMDYARDERARRIVGLITTMAELGRVSAAPPGTPAAQLADLRAAYRAALEDPALLDQAQRRGRPIEPAYGDDVRRLVIAALEQTPETIAFIKRALDPEGGQARVGSEIERNELLAFAAD